MAVAARTNPIKVGGTTSFVVTVSNLGANPERKVALVVALPPQLQYVEGNVENPTKASVSGQTVRFEPILQLDPRQPVHFEIQAKALLAGSAKLQAQATSPTTPQPVAGETTVTILAEP